VSRRNKSLSVDEIEQKITQHIADMKLEDEVQMLVDNAAKNYISVLNSLISSIRQRVDRFQDKSFRRCLNAKNRRAKNIVDQQGLAIASLVSSTDELKCKCLIVWKRQLDRRGCRRFDLFREFNFR